MEKQYVIRRLTEADLDIFFTTFSSLLETQFPEYTERSINYMLTNPRAWNKENFRSVLERESRIVLGAFIEESLVGLIEAEEPFGGVSLGVWLMVDPPFQKHGIGTALLTEWAKKVKELGGHNLYLYAEKRNKAFYEKVGFTLVGLQEKAWFGVDVYIFTKLIQEPKEENFLF
jgi:GNAT superfamily N-acetyltransferase